MLTDARPRLNALTSIRFFAALHVVLFHLRVFRVQILQLPDTWGWFGKFAGVGYLGVSFFFVLSGFILVYTYGGRTFTKRSFWRARFARIYPAYLLSLLLFAPFFFYGMLKMPVPPDFAWIQQHLAFASVLVLVLMQSWFPLACMTWNAVAWSLSCEAFFYACFPFLVGRMQKLSARKLVAVGVACWTVLLAITTWYVLKSPDGVQHTSSNYNSLFWLNVVKFNPLVRSFEFVIGMAFGFVFLRGIRVRNRSLVIAAALAAFAAAVAFSARIPYPILHTALLAPVFGTIIYGIALQPAWARPLEQRVPVLLGDASYSLYLLHPLVLGFGLGARERAYSPLGSVMLASVAVVISIGAYLLIERPARRWLRGKPPVTAAAVAAS
jgi:peptidoglycan/LPS O-acetylase OafA/YrhL